MPWWKSSLAVLLAASAAFAQMAASQSEGVKRVGQRIACQCGSCQDTVAGCKMQMCGFSYPAKQNINQKLAAGASDQAVIDEYKREYGDQILRDLPSPAGWIIPYAALAAGVAVIFWFIRRAYRPRPAAAPAGEAPPDPKLARYRDQIEKELANLD